MTGNLIKVTVYRFEAGRDREPRYETWQVPSGEGIMVLDALNYIRENYDPTLRFRHSCHMGKCGSCAVMVNGRPGLACWELAVDGMVIEPLRGLPVIADLVVERTEVDLDREGLAFQRRGMPVPQGQVERLPLSHRKELDETRTCINCFSCVSACPYVYAEEKEFVGPKRMVEIARHVYDPRQDENRPLVVAVHHGLWDCIACNACTSVCPQQINARQRILDLKSMVMESPGLQGLPRQIRRMNESILTLGNPYHYPKTDKGKWAVGLNLKDLTRGEKAEWLYFAGCAQSFDPRDQEVARGLVKLFQAIGLDFGTLGAGEPCCGDPARYSGEEGLAAHMREQNAELFARYRIARIVTTCPHGHYRFNEDRSAPGQQVKHYTQVLAAAIKDGRLKLRRPSKRTIVYHDSCYLGRYSGIYEEPRTVLAAIPGVKLVEMKDTRENSLCCGGGGGGSFLDVKARPRLSWVRVRQAIEAGADTIAVACPMCRAMLEDAVKNLESDIEVMHISELALLAL
jgi:succinate dehydrogenase/fumarate reductase iron-sulfur protein